VPAPGTKCDLVVSITDSTHDTKDKDDWPVLSLISDLADSEGLFESHDELTVPYEISTVEDISVLTFPVSALVFPKKGQRQARIRVSLTSSSRSSNMYCRGETFITHQQDTYGYTEIGKRDIEADKAMVVLALCLCAADGHISKTEAAVIRNHCTEAYMDLDHGEAVRRKEAINKTMRTFLDSYMKDYMRGRKVRKLWKQACERIMDRHGAQVAQTAYELCLRVAAADGVADDKELSMLAETAQLLSIPDELDRGLRDRYFKLAMFGSENHDDLLGIPDGLSREEKIEFLNREYQKWRRRATHGNCEIATEATLRVKKIAEARQRLENE